MLTVIIAVVCLFIGGAVGFMACAALAANGLAEDHDDSILE